MPKQVIVIMDDHYPFGQCEQSTSESTRVLVRKIYNVGVQERNGLLQKAGILKRLKYDQLIKLQSVLQQQQSVHFLFEYVPIRLQTWISNINDQFIENFRDQLIKFSSYLANNYIRVEFKLKNIGMDHNYGAKYFVDPTFIYDSSVNKQRLKSQYIRQISNLFKPYIDSTQQEEEVNVESKVVSRQLPQQYHQESITSSQININTNTNTNTAYKNMNSISPATYHYQDQLQLNVKDFSGINIKRKQKLQKYYQHMNASMDVQNQKILKQFMDVLDDDDDDQEQQQRAVVVDIQPVKENNDPLMDQQNRSLSLKYDHKDYQSEYHHRPHSKQQIPFTSLLLNNNSSPKSSQQFAHRRFPDMPIMNNEQNKQIQYRDRDGDDLQERIKRAIQHGRAIIDRFKRIKQQAS